MYELNPHNIPAQISYHQQQVKNAPLSFASSQTLDIYLDKLPQAGPPWKSISLAPTTSTPKKSTLAILYYHDLIEVIQYTLLSSALWEGINWALCWVYKDKEKTKHLYSDFSTGDWWWDIQVSSIHQQDTELLHSTP